ncbi:hypothetical protein [Trinickia mobilis]|uniref:hypothetical protein n=1 Tax=Trinickia mobilis TaxID=2816356 RepID=UPI001A8E30D4|nr:hypothetical protein [Trinickia mobilis]
MASESDLFRVFNPRLRQRLTAMNTATRALREMGYRIVDQQLTATPGDRPIIQIDRAAQQSISPLLDLTTDRQWRNESGKKRGFVAFMNVTVTWEPA